MALSNWVNSDGLVVRFGSDEGDKILGGSISTRDGKVMYEINIPYTEIASATDAVVGSVSGTSNGSRGVMLPKGLRIEAIETLVTAAFTSSGTVTSSTLVLGLKKASDLSTELDHDGFLTSSFVGSKLDAVGERNYQEVGTTGSGALIGTTLSENGVLSCSNSAHASHPYNGGALRVRIFGFWP